ncbi:homoserine kinase [Aquimarina sp. AU58]|uniref:homoserine kinase n=1 Tax=Aquimarina sp. AU58 TaxID=1874112 RepID=UPI000D6DEF99|nr:homoserine kinase [Aquimarina sp. AU58]
MALYTHLHKRDIFKIVQGFDISPLTQYYPLDGGFANTNYYLETETNTYVLSICDSKSFEEIDKLANLLIHFENHHYTTTKIIPNKNGSVVSTYDNKPLLLKEYISGTVLTQFSDDILIKLGVSLGQLHQLPSPPYIANKYPYGEQTFYELNESSTEHPFIIWLSDMHNYIKDNLHPDLPKSLIHGDLFYSNVIIDSNGEPIIIDFEEACFYYRIFDLGMAIVGLCCEDGKIIFSKIHILLKGYQSITSLTSLEKEKLKAFVIYAATATAFWRFRQFNIIFPTENLKNSFEEMQNIVDQLYKISDEKIFN